MMKKTMLLLALTVNVLGVAEGSFAAETDPSASSHEAAAIAVIRTGETGNLDGSIPGQFLPGTMTDFVKGEGYSTRAATDAVWRVEDFRLTERDQSKGCKGVGHALHPGP